MSVTSYHYNHGGTPPAGAITSVFTMPPDCANYGAGRYITVASCMPPEYFELYWTLNYGYYSPAICPDGYTGACPRNTQGWMTGPPIEQGETATICCPRYMPIDAFVYYVLNIKTAAINVHLSWIPTVFCTAVLQPQPGIAMQIRFKSGGRLQISQFCRPIRLSLAKCIKLHQRQRELPLL